MKFSSSSDAKVVADTLSGYVLEDRRLVCHLVAEDANMWGSKFREVDWVALHRARVNAEPKGEGEVEKISKRDSAKIKKKLEKLKGMGIDVDFGEVTGQKTNVAETKKVAVKKGKGKGKGKGNGEEAKGGKATGAKGKKKK